MHTSLDESPISTLVLRQAIDWQALDGYTVRPVSATSVQVFQSGTLVATFTDGQEQTATAQADAWIETQLDQFSGILND
jgi:hypothetical protein